VIFFSIITMMPQYNEYEEVYACCMGCHPDGDDPDTVDILDTEDHVLRHLRKRPHQLKIQWRDEPDTHGWIAYCFQCERDNGPWGYKNHRSYVSYAALLQHIAAVHGIRIQNHYEEYYAENFSSRIPLDITHSLYQPGSPRELLPAAGEIPTETISPAADKSSASSGSDVPKIAHSSLLTRVYGFLSSCWVK
jgi:hypothetical protein